MEKSEWIKWEGGECPVLAQTEVEYETRRGNTSLDIAGDLRWEHLSFGGDIVAYRVVKEATKPTSPEDIGSAATSKHYNAQAIQPIELMEMSFSKEEFKGFLKGNILKYSMRAGSKSGESVFKDTVKAKQYKMWLDLVDQGIKIDPRVHVVIKGD